MDRYELTNELTLVIEDYLKSISLELVDLIYRHEGRDLFLMVLADRPEGGITLDECGRINREVGLILDEKNIIPEPYILEVSSPGLDRPLRTEKDFRRCRNKKAVFYLSEPLNSRVEWEGLILKIEEERVYIDAGGQALEIPLAKINKAKQVI